MDRGVNVWERGIFQVVASTNHVRSSLAMVLAGKLRLVTVASGVARLEVGGQSTLDC